MGDQLHIVSFDNPFPPDYGGVIDVYFKIKALSEKGLRINLHAFEYGRKPTAELEKLCESVNYYNRRLYPGALLSRTPFIVKSRNSQELLDNLSKDDHSILFEGLHTCGFLNSKIFKDRFKLVRTHNIEHDYYRSLARNESNRLRKRYFRSEARKLEAFEVILKHADAILPVDDSDYEYFNARYGKTTRVFPFHPDFDTSIKPDLGSYAFYHANFSVPENRQALKFLIDEVFKDSGMEMVIAGKDADRAFAFGNGAVSGLRVYPNPTQEEMLNLALGAGVHVLPAFQATGFKLKLLYSLSTGRTVIANPAMMKGSGLENWVVIARTAEEFRRAVRNALQHPTEESLIEARRKFLLKNYSNEVSAQRIIDLLP